MTSTPPVRSDRHPLSLDGSVELAVVSRSGFDESRHVGAGVVVDASGRMIDAIGDATASVYPRSTLKPFQAVAIRRAGARFAGEQLVLTTASHAGTDAHQSVVLAMLAASGHTVDDLGCPADFPFDAATARTMTEPTRLAMNCSGKHAGMLAACRVHGWGESTYLDPAHPLQLHGLARGMADVVGPTDEGARDLTTAVLAHPWAIDGHGRANTVTIEQTGVFAKLGAEGVMVMGVPGAGAVAVKVLDGSHRAGTLAALTLLARAGMVDPDLARAVIETTTPEVLGRGLPVGRVRAGTGLAA
jgi:L-asparaginase II